MVVFHSSFGIASRLPARCQIRTSTHDSIVDGEEIIEQAGHTNAFMGTNLEMINAVEQLERYTSEEQLLLPMRFPVAPILSV